MTHYEQFADHNSMAEPLTQEQIDEMLQWVMRHGPANCWTGTSGDPAKFIRALLIDRANIARRLDAALQENEIGVKMKRADAK